MKKILIGLGVIILGILGYAATKPDTLTVERRISIKASKEKIYPLLNNFEDWKKWSPWEKLDPNVKKTFSEIKVGKGAVYSWEGNSDVGKGRMEILETDLQAIKIKLDFIEPMEGHNITTISLKEANGSTDVIWNMSGPETYFGKLFGVFVNLDNLIGKDFEEGLANLKKLSE
jgi:hypothetical protein